MVNFFKNIKRNRTFFVQWADGCAFQKGNMPECAQIARQIARQRADIGAFAAQTFKCCFGLCMVRDCQVFNIDVARLDGDALTFAGEVIGALSVNFNGRKLWWNL